MTVIVVPDSWASRDLPVLAAIVAAWDQCGPGEIVESWSLVDTTGLEHFQIDRAGTALTDAGLIAAQFLGNEGFIVNTISGTARTLVGSWPTPRTAADRLLAALEQAVADAPDDDQRGRAQRALDSLRSLGRDVLVNASGSMLGTAGSSAFG